ncbi:MAG: DUF362 domain-containing protein [Nitrospirae bacterium]|nr:DUF362 domain-containing protein [Nitrospirota bacterium]
MKHFLDDPRVALVKENPSYAGTSPFHPDERYPEWPGMPIGKEDNPAYRAVRRLFYLLNLDKDNYGMSRWNPLKSIIRPGNRVVLKPNLVSHFNHGAKAYGLTDTDSLVTHGSLIRAVLDYCAKALEEQGTIIICDCPIQGADWEKLTEFVGLSQIRDFFCATHPEIELQVKDYRLGTAVMKHGVMVRRLADENAMGNYLEVDIGQDSLLLPLMQNGCEFGVSQYSKQRMKKAHNLQSNKYLFPKDILHTDVLINLPKMKTHMKAGVTCALKNLVGINGHKDYLPHFRFGSPKNGGDEYPDGNWLWDLMWFLTHKEWETRMMWLKSSLYFLTKVCSFFLPAFSGLPKGSGCIGGGGWHGNDTLWRTILDINRVFFYFDRRNERVDPGISDRTKYLAILDGLIAGEKESPLAPTPVRSGIMMASFNPLAMDTVAAAMMGLDIHSIKQIVQGFDLKKLPLAKFSIEDIEILGQESFRCVSEIYSQKAYIPFNPSVGFKGFVEYR